MTATTPEITDLAITWPDMEENFPCERTHFPTCFGHNPAEWILVLAACNCSPARTLMWCDSCRVRVLRQQEIRCGGCVYVWKPASEAYLSIEPLGLSK